MIGKSLDDAAANRWQVPEVELASLDLAALRLTKEVILSIPGKQLNRSHPPATPLTHACERNIEDHSRWVFYAPHGLVTDLRPNLPHQQPSQVRSRAQYLKVWNPTYCRRDNVLHAIDAKFYNAVTTPALRAIVVSGGVCRGYIMDRCKPQPQLDLNYFNTIKQATVDSGYFAVQFSRYHVGKCADGYSMFDLEAVYPLHALGALARTNERFDHTEYGQFVLDLYAQNFSEEAVLELAHTMLRGREETVSGHAISRACGRLYRKSTSLFRLSRERLSRTKPQLHLIKQDTK